MSIAVVTGANRGLGLEVCRQLAAHGHEVIAGSRDPAKGPRGIANVRVEQLDVTDAESIERLAQRLDRVDILVNNAAILYDTWARASTADLAQVHEALETNLFGAWRTTLAFLPHLRRSGTRGSSTSRAGPDRSRRWARARRRTPSARRR